MLLINKKICAFQRAFDCNQVKKIKFSKKSKFLKKKTFLFFFSGMKRLFYQMKQFIGYWLKRVQAKTGKSIIFRNDIRSFFLETLFLF
jgi:hypothetical protein